MPTIISMTFETERPVYFHFPWPLFPILIAAAYLLIVVQSSSFRDIIEAASLVPAP